MPLHRHSLSCACVVLAAALGWTWLAENRRSDPQPAGKLPHGGPAAHASVPREAVGGFSNAVPQRARAGLPGRPVVSMPVTEDFTRRVLSADHRRVTIPLPDGKTVDGRVAKLEIKDDVPLLVEGTITRPELGRFHFRRQQLPGKAGALFGFIHFEQSPLAWQVRPTGEDGAPELVRVTVDEVICRSFASPPAEIPAAHPVDDPVPADENGIIQLQSLPGAGAVVYLDFDGETRDFEVWGFIDAAPSGAGNAEIFEVWQGVSEDFQPFAINITTSRRIYESAAANQRMQVVITPTDTAAPCAGGVAIIGSFNSDGEVVCWAFHSAGKNAVEAISHEIGHTLGLSHDGRVSPYEKYYAGHSDWAPIMGIGYGRPLTQWSKGEYPNANNFQDDLLIISSHNNAVSYRADDHGSTTATAGWLGIHADGTAFAEGIIETRTDRDSFRFSTTGGDLALSIHPVPPIAGGTVAVGNLDLKAELLRVTSSLTSIIATSNPDDSLAASLNFPNLAAGDYLVRISGTGRSDLVTGYSDYASLGSYAITGNVAGGVHAERFLLAENSANGAVVGSVPPRAAHSSGVLNFQITQDGSGGAFAIDPATGEITVADSNLLDFEALSSRWDDPAALDFIVTIGDSLEHAMETIHVVVTLTDVNEPPVFESTAPCSIPDRVATGTPVTRVRAHDPDRADHVIYSIVSGNQGGVFAIDPGTGEVTVAGTPDCQLVPLHHLVIRATDQADPPNESEVLLEIALLPVAGDVVAGSLTRTFYHDIPGAEMAALVASPRFPERPDRQAVLASFDSGTGAGYEYGSVVSGYVIAPATGSYVFWIAAGTSGELWLSPGMNRQNAVAVAAIDSPSAPGEWNKEAGQQSAPVALTAGAVYYIEARQKQHYGTDHVQVAWQGPGMAGKEIIPGLWLAPDDRQFAPWAENTALAVRDGAAAGTRVGGLPFLEPNLGQQVAGYAITSGNEDGNFTIDPADGTIRVAAGASFTAGASYPLTIAATDDGAPAAVGSAIAEITVRRLDEGLFAWWQLDEGTGAMAFDSSGNQRDAWLAGSASWVWRATADHALQLDGIDAGFSRFDPAAPAGFTPFTVAAWVKVPPEHAAEAVVVQQAGDSGPGYQRVSITADGKVRFVVYGHEAEAGATDEGFQFNLISAGSIHDGQWHHIACVRDGGDGRIFIDGLENAGGSGTPRLLEGDSTFSVGYDAVAASGHLGATVDDVRIYQEALAAAQISRIAAAPKIAFSTPLADTGVIVPEGVGLLLGAAASSPSAALPVISWSMLSGPGAVDFDDPAAAETGVSFFASGIYVFRATATLANDDVSRDIAVIYGCTAVTPFSGGQIGTEGTGSHANSGAGTYLISGESRGILEGGTSDDFYLLGQVFSGDFEVMGRVDGALDDEVGYPLGIAGLIVRAGTAGATDDASGFIGLRPANTAGTWIRRTTAGAGNEVTDFAGVTVPHWCRITRRGDLVEFWHSPDGRTWTPRGMMMLSGNLNVGMCWSSNAPGYGGTAYFSRLAGFSIGNQGALVDAGVDFFAETTIAARLSGAVNDDGLPDPPATTTSRWQVLSGPGPVDIATPSSPFSAVTFAAPGTYVLRLLASDGALTTFDNVTVTVADPLPVLTVEATSPAASEQGPVHGVFTITRSVWLAGDLSVAFTLGGAAENSLDYEELATSTIIPDGEASVEIVIVPIADGWVEGPESVTLTLAAGGYLISGADAEISIADSNHPPEWAPPVFAVAGGTVGRPYSGSMAAEATDPDTGDDLIFTKESGPGWLEIAADGTLSGTPGSSDVGLNEFTIRVTDQAGEFAETTIEIIVGPAALYLDANGETAGSGASGTIVWDNSPLWSADPDGVSATHAWMPGATAALAAGDDATATIITLIGSQSLAGLLVEEGTHTLSGGALVLVETHALFDISTHVIVESPIIGIHLAKTGAGTLVLSGADHTLSGELAVLDGRLEIAGTITPANVLTVATGAQLAGDGTVAGHVSVNGTLAPGADLGTLSTGPLALNDGSTLAWRVDSWAGSAGTGHDLLAADALTLSGTVTVRLEAMAMADFTDASAQFTLVTTTGGITGFESARFLVDSASLPQASGHWSILKNGNDLMLTYTPLTPFEQWQLAQFAEQSNDPMVAGELADPDADGLPNLIEYALGTHPEWPGPGTITREFVEIEGSLFLRLRVPRNASASDIDIVVEATSDLSDPESWSALDTMIETDEPSLLVVRDALGGPRRFMRLRVTR